MGLILYGLNRRFFFLTLDLIFIFNSVPAAVNQLVEIGEAVVNLVTGINDEVVIVLTRQTTVAAVIVVSVDPVVIDNVQVVIWL